MYIVYEYVYEYMNMNRCFISYLLCLLDALDKTAKPKILETEPTISKANDHCRFAFATIAGFHRTLKLICN